MPSGPRPLLQGFKWPVHLHTALLQGRIQRNKASTVTSVNARFGWLWNTNTGLFVVLNIVRNADAIDGLDNQVFTVKYTHRFDLVN